MAEGHDCPDERTMKAA